MCIRDRCQHFIDCVREGKQPRTDGYNGLRVVQVVEAAQASLRLDGQTVVVSTDGPRVAQRRQEEELVHA